MCTGKFRIDRRWSLFKTCYNKLIYRPKRASSSHNATTNHTTLKPILCHPPHDDVVGKPFYLYLFICYIRIGISRKRIKLFLPTIIYIPQRSIVSPQQQRPRFQLPTNFQPTRRSRFAIEISRIYLIYGQQLKKWTEIDRRQSLLQHYFARWSKMPVVELFLLLTGKKTNLTVLLLLLMVTVDKPRAQETN